MALVLEVPPDVRWPGEGVIVEVDGPDVTQAIRAPLVTRRTT